MNIENTIKGRIVILGANGGIGKHTVEQALDRGHTVVAIVRNPQSLSLDHPNLVVKKADVMQYETLLNIIGKDDVVISAIGKSSTKETTLYSQGNSNIMQAMKQAGATRLFVISASGLEVNPTHNMMLRWATKNVLQRILKHMYADLERMEHLIKASDLTWTIVRPPRLTEGAHTGSYRVSANGYLSNPQSISRADVADFILKSIGNAGTFRKTVELAY
jgi:putative NADH-flavin reductase